MFYKKVTLLALCRELKQLENGITLFFFKVFVCLFVLILCICGFFFLAWMCVCAPTMCSSLEVQKGASDTLVLEIQKFVSCRVGIRTWTLIFWKSILSS